MLCGLPSSGKSTYTEKMQEIGYVVHSSDELRKELFGDIDCQDKNDILFRELERRIRNDLSNGYNVIYDACNINYKRRITFLQSITYFSCRKKCILFATPIDICIYLNEQRERKVPEKVIDKMYKTITIPQYYEGWDEIEILFMPSTLMFLLGTNDSMCNMYSNKYSNTEKLLKEMDISQDNPHHKLTIKEHSLLCFELLKKCIGKSDTMLWNPLV
jgi:predicted kinase